MNTMLRCALGALTLIVFDPQDREGAPAVQEDTSAGRAAVEVELEPAERRRRCNAEWAAKQRAESRLVSGSLVVVAEDGTRHVPPDGVVRLWELRWNQYARARVARLQDGVFSLRVRGSPTFEVGRILTGGREAYAPGASERTLKVEGVDVGTIEARWLRPLSLRVVGLDSGRSLGRVEAMRANGNRHQFHPGPYEDHEDDRRPRSRSVPVPDRDRVAVARGAEGLVVLPPWSTHPYHRDQVRVADWWVRAEGYAWTRVEVDHASGGERQLALAPAGTLWIDVTRRAGCEHERVRVRALDTPSWPNLLFVPLGREPTASVELEGVPAGSYAVDLVCGSGLPHQLTSRAARLAVVARAEEVNIELAAQPEVQRGAGRAPRAKTGAEASGVVASGTLDVPRAWGESRPTLHLFRLAPGSALREGAGFQHVARLAADSQSAGGSELWGTWPHYRWRLQDALPGTYLAGVEPFAHHQVFEVGPTGSATVELNVAEPADVRVRLVEQGTGRPLVGTVHWSTGPADHPGGMAFASARQGPGKAAAEFRAPLGRLELLPQVNGYATVEPFQVVELVSGVNSLEVEYWPRCFLDLELLDGEAVVPHAGLGMGLRAYGSDGARVYPELNFEGARLRVGFARPGTYELSIPELRGFEALPTQYVDVGEARRSLRVQLVRALP